MSFWFLVGGTLGLLEKLLPPEGNPGYAPDSTSTGMNCLSWLNLG